MQLTDPRYYDKKVPRSIRLNNSGAIEYGPFTKKYGAIGSDGRYAIFPTDGPNAYGVKAHGALLSSYGKRGLNTLSAITQRWAPNNPKDPTNNPAVYAADVASKAGIRPDTPITPDMYARVIHAMSRHEAGRDPAFTVEQAQALLGGGALPAAAPGATEPMRPRAGMAAPQQAPLDISAISPEQAATLAKMGMRTGRAPQNVGEGLHYIGETINNAAWRNQLLDAFKTGNAQSNAAWQAYAGGGMAAPAAAPAQVAQQPSPVAPAGGMAAPGSFRGAQEAGMAGAPVSAGSAGSPAPSAGSAGPVGGMADPRLAQLDAEISRTRAALANPATRSFAMQRLQKLEDQKFALSDPMRAVQQEAANIDLELKRRDLNAPKTSLKTLKDGETLYRINERTGQYERIAGEGGAPGQPSKAYREAFDREQAQSRAKALDGLPAAEHATRETLRVISDILADPNIQTGTGYSGMLPSVSTGARAFDSKVQQLVQKTFIQNVQALKGAGALSDAEGKRLTDAASRIGTRGLSLDEFRRELQDLQRQTLAGLEVARKRAGLQSSQAQEPVRVSSPDEAMKLPPGTVFVTPDGRTMRVPNG